MNVMRVIPLLVVVGFSSLLMGASWFGSNPDEEISPLQYSALLGLRDVDSKLFTDKLLPLIDKAMADGKISVAELAEIEKAAGSVGKAFYAVAREPSLQERMQKVMDKAGKEGKDLGDKLGGAFLDLFEGFKEPAKPSNKDGVAL